MTEFYQGRAWIELSRTALRHNVEQLQTLLPPNCALMPAVKANAYGHGAVLIARELNTLPDRNAVPPPLDALCPENERDRYCQGGRHLKSKCIQVHQRRTEKYFCFFPGRGRK